MTRYLFLLSQILRSINTTKTPAVGYKKKWVEYTRYAENLINFHNSLSNVFVIPNNRFKIKLI